MDNHKMDNHKFEFIDSINMVSPFRKVLNYLIWGLIFASIHLNVFILPTLSIAVSSILFYLGLRMIKNQSRPFLIAYYISILFIFISIVEIALLATEFKIPDFLVYIFVFLRIIQVFLITNGFDALIKDKMYPFWVGFIYIIMTLIAVIAPFIYILYPFIFIVLFGIIIYLLMKTKKYLVENNYQLNLSQVKSDTHVFIFQYLLLSILSICICMYLVPILLPRYIDNKKIDYEQYQLLDTLQKEFDTNGVFTNAKANTKIYEYDQDYYLYVYDFSFKKPVHKISTIDLQIYHRLSLNHWAIFDVYDISVDNGHKNYYIEKKATGTNDINIEDSILMKFDQSDIYKVRVNPFENEINIHLALKVDKMKRYDEVGNFFEDLVNFNIYNYGEYPYIEEYDNRCQYQTIIDMDKWSINE